MCVSCAMLGSHVISSVLPGELDILFTRAPENMLVSKYFHLANRENQGTERF